MNKKKRPFREDYNMCRITIDETSSARECTGLEPRPPLNESEQESYSNIYDFFPDDIVAEEKDAD